MHIIFTYIHIGCYRLYVLTCCVCLVVCPFASCMEYSFASSIYFGGVTIGKYSRITWNMNSPTFQNQCSFRIMLLRFYSHSNVCHTNIYNINLYNVNIYRLLLWLVYPMKYLVISCDIPYKRTRCFSK